MVLRNHVSAIDELGMATERLRVRLPDEPKPKLLHIIEPHEVSERRALYCRLAMQEKMVTDLHSNLALVFGGFFGQKFQGLNYFYCILDLCLVAFLPGGAEQSKASE